MKYSLVFGACGGIGKALSVELTKRGKNLILCGTSMGKLTMLNSELLSINKAVKTQTFTCDLSNEESRKTLYNTLNNYDIDELYYVAGIDTRKDFLKFSEDKIIRQIRVNFEGAVSSINYCLKNKKSGLKILVVSSMCGFLPMPYYSLYSATKSALNYFCFALKKELDKRDVKLTVLAPGSVMTRDDIIEDIKMQGLTGKLSKKSPEYVVKKGLKALEKNKRLCIPGTYNKFVNFINKITPLGIKTGVIKRKFKGIEKDSY